MLNKPSLPTEVVSATEVNRKALGSQYNTSAVVFLMLVTTSKGPIKELLIDEFNLVANKVFAAAMSTKRTSMRHPKGHTFEARLTPGVVQAFELAATRAGTMLRDFQKEEDIIAMWFDDILVGLLEVNDLDLQRLLRKLGLNRDELLKAASTEQPAFAFVA